MAFSAIDLADLSQVSNRFGHLSGNQGNFVPSASSRYAYAKSSGGRTGGGSFRRSSPSSPSRSTTPSRSNDTNSRPDNSRSFDSNRDRGGGTTVVPVIINNGQSRPSTNTGSGLTSTSSSGGDAFLGFIIIIVALMVIGGIGWWIFYLIKQSTSSNNFTGGFSQGEVGNDTVTVTKLQVALLAQARELQSRLSEIALEVDTNTPEGLHWLMQESVIALLRTPENWTHALSSSQATKTEAAEKIFNQISVAERSKFSVESLVNVRGVNRKQTPIAVDPEKEPAAYIVVTMIIGTEHDKPLFGQIRSEADLKAALEAIAAIPPSHLLVFELLWSPQAETDSLTYDELLTEYSDIVQI
ncbi:DUF1517 domain-containing protein [Pseudanabaena sp. PCC 6802]|uniref:DUF1517 domain-containing protein n=1 Tax=Pseudanabaena sp. PCC 6802 TaxID=118173 RepID=UPI00034DEFBD|nr:DUF1517 domain-containing protein [Pseudanabaena sp. PCC 6802]